MADEHLSTNTTMKKIVPRVFDPSVLVGQYVLGHSFKTQDSEFHLLCSDGSQTMKVVVTHSNVLAGSVDCQQRPKSADVPELEFSENLEAIFADLEGTSLDPPLKVEAAVMVSLENEAGTWRYHYNDADPFLTRAKKDRCEVCDHEGRHSGGQIVRHAGLGLRIEGMDEVGWIWCQTDWEDTDRYGHPTMDRHFFDIVVEMRIDLGR